MPSLFPRPAVRRPAVVLEAGHRWAVLLPMALMLASDYKLRSRPVDETVGGSPDLTVFLEIGVYGLAALYLYWRFGMRPPVRRTTGLLFAAWAFTGYVAMSALWSPFMSLGVVRGAQLLVTMALVQVLATRATVADLHRLAHAFVIVVLGSVAIGVAHPFPRTPQTLTRFNWLYVHPVIAGVYLGIAVLLVFGLLIRSRRYGEQARGWPPLVYAAVLLVLMGALVATGTRGAAAGAAAGLLVLMATARGPRGRIDLVVIGGAVGAVGVLAFADKIMNFVARGETADKLASLNSRTDLWTLAMRAYQEKPIFGHGLGASRGLFLQDIGLGGGHNAFVNALVDNGTVGTALFVALLLTLGTVLVTLVRRRELRGDAGTLLGILAFFLVDGITTEGLAMPANVSGIWLLLLVAFTEALRRGRFRTADEPPRVLVSVPGISVPGTTLPGASVPGVSVADAPAAPEIESAPHRT
ncbi:O-antigen ligase family protein [Actinomadura rupiterrae]|uniref:O-antigen ligase family protein n=1 Tax=Actinomadura rupiterrae TaxID=559627 RepID=UPI0020A4F464|nr:O-antigen ligase family protein [Actinomadura rupiterrae]MCP2336857.1 O-antigen ligase [Actinomadura rupiterrae]